MKEQAVYDTSLLWPYIQCRLVGPANSSNAFDRLYISTVGETTYMIKQMAIRTMATSTARTAVKSPGAFNMEKMFESKPITSLFNKEIPKDVLHSKNARNDKMPNADFITFLSYKFPWWDIFISVAFISKSPIFQLWCTFCFCGLGYNKIL